MKSVTSEYTVAKKHFLSPWRLWNESASIARSVAIGYAVAGGIALVAAARVARRAVAGQGQGSPAVLWLFIGLVFVFLAADRLLGILPRFTCFGRRGLLGACAGRCRSSRQSPSCLSA
jgi:hypothetical protein